MIYESAALTATACWLWNVEHEEEQRGRHPAALALTFSSMSCCLKSSSSSESQSGNWYILIPYCSISSRIYKEMDERENTEWKDVLLSLRSAIYKWRCIHSSRNKQISSVNLRLALNFFFFTSLGVSVSALAKIGTMLTFSCRAFMNSTSKGRRLEVKQSILMHYTQSMLSGGKFIFNLII